ncbi:MAG TPA: carbohydrate kinase family protein [Pyrinomonadaceae bacterium]|jgi:sugar/nucleoside kinase (ribokinase family)
MTKRGAGNGVVVIGELNIDAVACGLSEVPKMGAEILASDFRLTLGSASGIFACGVAKLGHEVAFIAKVGSDDFGEFCLAALRDAGVSTRHVSREEHLKTGVTISLSTRKDRALVTYLGSIAAMGPEHVKRSWLEGHRHLHMTSYFLQTRMQPSFPQMFRDARELGLSTSFDPNSDPSHTWGDSIRDVFAYTDLLFLNATEALQLTRARNARAALKALSREVPCAVIKLGARGALAVREGEITSASGFKVEPIDTTGAGDSFAAGFVSSYLRGRSVAECLRVGNACGALTTLQVGGTAGQPTRQALKRFLGAHRTAEHFS